MEEKQKITEENRQRNIKFRAWDNKEKKWLMGYDYPSLGGFSMFGEAMLFNQWSEIINRFILQQKDRSPEDLILMQYVGLRYQDKDCYVGDIIDIGQTINGQSAFVIMDCIGGYDVRYAHDTKRKYEYDINELLDIGAEDSEIKIIGNIYETPELLKP